MIACFRHFTGIFILLLLVIASCNTQKQPSVSAIPIPDFAVYQLKNAEDTTKVFFNLDETKSIVVYYPSPEDLKRMSKIECVNGYVIDRRGVGPTTVFTSHTIPSYIEKGVLPDLATWMEEVKEFEPFLRFCRCKGTIDINQLKEELKKGHLRLCDC